MVEIITGTILTFIAIAIFVLGYLVKDQIFTYISGSMLLLIGISMLFGGIQIQTGEVIEHNTYDYEELNITYHAGNSTLTRQYENFDGAYSKGIGTIILWLAIYIGLVGWEFYKKGREEKGYF